MKRVTYILFLFALLPGCEGNKGPKDIPPEYWYPLDVGLIALQDTAENYKYKLLRDSFEGALPPATRKAIQDSAVNHSLVKLWEGYREIRLSDSARIMCRAATSVITEGREIGREFHNDYEEWLNLGYSRTGYVQGITANSSITLWEGTFASGVDAVNKFYSKPENRIVPITVALYIMNQRLNHGLQGDEFDKRVSEFRKAAHEQAAQEEGAK